MSSHSNNEELYGIFQVSNCTFSRSPFCVLVGLLFLVSSSIPSLANSASRTLSLGLCEDYQEHKTTDTDIRRDMKHLRESGTKRLRFALAWDGTHTGPEEFDYSFWDRLVSIAKEHDIELIPYIGYTPRWLADGPDTEYWTRPPRDYEQFGEFVERTARRYRDRIDSWEIWTEPDNTDYWKGTEAEFARIIQTASNALDHVEGEQQLVFGGITWDVSFLRRQFEDHNVHQWVDVVNAHSYYETWHPAPLERLPSYLNRIQSVIDQHGSGEDLWMAEVGYSNYKERDGTVSGVYRARYEFEHTKQQQAIQLFRTITILQNHPDVDFMAWYRLNDLSADEPVIGDDNNRHLGLYSEQGKPKPAREAFRFASQFFEGSIQSNVPINLINNSSTSTPP